MIYLAHTAHCQFLGLILGFLAWIFTMTTAGLNEWRLWHVEDVSVVTSGVAWVGIWRACFYTHALPQMEFCQSLGVADPFLPPEIPAAQAMMMLAVVAGLVANVSGAMAVRMALFSLHDRRRIRLLFVLAGGLYLSTGTCSLVPLVWNMNAVLANATIDFPPEFHLPPAPLRQQVGSAIGVGIFASVMMLVSGLLFLSYKYVRHTLRPEAPRGASAAGERKSERSNGTNQGHDNPAFSTADVS